MAEASHDLERLTQRIMQSQTRHGEKLVSMESGTPLTMTTATRGGGVAQHLPEQPIAAPKSTVSKRPKKSG